MPTVRFLELIYDPIIEAEEDTIVYEPNLNPTSQPILEKRSSFEDDDDDFIKTQDLRAQFTPQQNKKLKKQPQ